jgi:hypothetical protein
MTAANPYGYGPQTAEERAANDEACRRAVRLVAQMYLEEIHGRPLNSRLCAERSKAERMARGLAEWNRKRARA